MTRPRLRQMPMFFPPELRPLVEALPEREYLLAVDLHRLVCDDDRSWLEVIAAAVRELGTSLEAALSRDRHCMPTRARHRAWYEIKDHTTRTVSEIARTFGVHPSTALAGIARHAARLEEAREAQEAVLAFQASQDAASQDAGGRAA